MLGTKFFSLSSSESWSRVSKGIRCGIAVTWTVNSTQPPTSSLPSVSLPGNTISPVSPQKTVNRITTYLALSARWTELCWMLLFDSQLCVEKFSTGFSLHNLFVLSLVWMETRRCTKAITSATGLNGLLKSLHLAQRHMWTCELYCLLLIESTFGKSETDCSSKVAA